MQPEWMMKYIQDFFLQQKPSKMIDEKLRVKRTALVMEGMGINHAHIKLLSFART